MARRLGNYVSGVGGGTNWASGISQSLTDLSKSLISQGQAEDERARMDARDAELDRRFNLEQERLAAQDKIAAEERRIAAKDRARRIKREDLIRGREDDEFNRKLGIRTTLEGYDPNAVTFKDIQTFTPKIAERVEGAAGSKAIGEMQSILDEAFNPATDPNTRKSLADRYVSNVESVYGKELTPQQRDSLASRVMNISSQVNIPEDPDMRAKAISDAYSILGVTDLQQSRDNIYKNAFSNLTSEEARSFHSRRLQSLGVPRAEADAEAQAIVAGNYGRRSLDSITAARKAAADAQYEQAKEQYEMNKDRREFLLDVVDDLSSSSSSSKKYTPSSNVRKDIETLLKEGGIHENVDEDELNQLVTRYKKLIEGIPQPSKDGKPQPAVKFSPDTAMAATLASFKPHWFDDDITPLADAQQFALNLRNLRTNSGSSNPNKDIIKQSRKELEKLLAPTELPTRLGPDMDAWKATRWGQRAVTPLSELIR